MKKKTDNIKRVAILGSTGSIGRQAIDVISNHPDRFEITALAAARDVDSLTAQVLKQKPRRACLIDSQAALALKERCGGGVEVGAGEEGLLSICSSSEVDLVLNAIVGSAGLAATIASLESGKDVALANKESLVAAGDLVRKKLDASTGSLRPVDSEHSALWQCLLGENAAEVARMILTASGGPFWGRDPATLAEVTPEQALAHPRWKMGPRITIDSATLMNKGFEVIEARHLFNLPLEKIDIVIHPQSIVHSLVEFIDGSMKAHLGPTDMRIPILYSLSSPDRLDAKVEKLDIARVGRLDFESVDLARAPCLRLALDAAHSGRSYPAALNAADEIAVGAFLDGMISFDRIGDIIERVLEDHDATLIQTITDFNEVDREARRAAALAVKAQSRSKT